MAKERDADNEFRSALDGVAAALTALERAEQLGRRAAEVGFDWPDAEGPKSKIAEELRELDEAEQGADTGHVAEELGDLLFAVVNLARHLEVGAELALADANGKFERRFRRMERAIRADGNTVGDLPLHTLEEYWQAAKSAPDPAA